MEPRPAPRSVDRRISKLATAQHGVVGLPQLVEAGLGRGGLRGRVSSGRLHRVHRGVYAVGHPRLTPHGRWLAAVLAVGETALLSHTSAAALWGMRASSRAVIEVCVPSRAGRRPPPEILVHRVDRLDRADATRREGIPVTTPARTLLDLAAVLPATALDRAIEQAEVLRLSDLRALEALLAAHPGRRGTARLRAALQRWSPEAPMLRSELEARFLELCVAYGLPRPAVNVALGPFEVDFLWRAARLVVETDGHRHHGTRAAFERDRRRDARLTLAGCRVVRLTHAQVVREPEQVAVLLRGLLG